jgi:hypothetical protein
LRRWYNEYGDDPAHPMSGIEMMDIIKQTALKQGEQNENS